MPLVPERRSMGWFRGRRGAGVGVDGGRSGVVRMGILKDLIDLASRLGGPSGLCRRLSRAVAGHWSLGARGERAAWRHLSWRGYELVGRNMRLGGVEADLVLLAPDGATLVVVEVKALRDPGMHPAERVDWLKRRRLERFGDLLLRQRRHHGRGLRYDIVAVRPGRLWLCVEHLPGAWREGE